MENQMTKISLKYWHKVMLHVLYGDIMKDCSKKSVVLAKSNAKQRMYLTLKKVEEIKLYLKNILSEEHYILIQNITDNCTEKRIFKEE